MSMQRERRIKRRYHIKHKQNALEVSTWCGTPWFYITQDLLFFCAFLFGVLFGIEGCFGPIMLSATPPTAVRIFSVIWLTGWSIGGYFTFKRFYIHDLLKLKLTITQDSITILRTLPLFKSEENFTVDGSTTFMSCGSEFPFPCELILLTSDKTITIDSSLSYKDVHILTTRLGNFLAKHTSPKSRKRKRRAAQKQSEK